MNFPILRKILLAILQLALIFLICSSFLISIPFGCSRGSPVKYQLGVIMSFGTVFISDTLEGFEIIEYFPKSFL